MSRVFNMVGGGGASLNFKVVGGTTQPTNPSENMIWVNTSTTISGWVFSSTEPIATEDGLVWFSTGVAAAVPINILRDNTIVLYPTAVHQFVNGAWVTKEAMTFQNNEWKVWYTYIYNLGDEFTSVTGGWQSGGQASTSAGYSGGSTITKNANNITVYVPAVSGRILTTASKIDLTAYSKLGMTVNSEEGLEEDARGPGAYLIVRDRNSGDWTPGGNVNTQPAGTVAYQVFSEAGQVEVDISSLSGTYCVGMWLAGYSAKTVVISNFYLVR